MTGAFKRNIVIDVMISEIELGSMYAIALRTSTFIVMASVIVALR